MELLDQITELKPFRMFWFYWFHWVPGLDTPGSDPREQNDSASVLNCWTFIQEQNCF